MKERELLKVSDTAILAGGAFHGPIVLRELAGNIPDVRDGFEWRASGFHESRRSGEKKRNNESGNRNGNRRSSSAKSRHSNPAPQLPRGATISFILSAFE